MKVFGVLLSLAAGVIFLGMPVWAQPSQHAATHLKKAQAKSKPDLVVKRQTFTQAQISAISDALKALRKLSASTQVGVTISEYQDRLIDTKGDVNEDLRAIPSGAVQSDILAAMQAYQDASLFWNDCVQLIYRSQIAAGPSATVLAKYHLVLSDSGEADTTAFLNSSAECSQLESQFKANKVKAEAMIQDEWEWDSLPADQQAAKHDELQGLLDTDDKISAQLDELTNSMKDEKDAALKIDVQGENKILSAIWNIAVQKEHDAELSLTK